MDAKSLFLTANADTIYFFGYLDLSKRPMVLEVPPKALGAIDDTGSGGSPISVCPGPIGAKGGNT
jgi:hypothetical protein